MFPPGSGFQNTPWQSLVLNSGIVQAFWKMQVGIRHVNQGLGIRRSPVLWIYLINI